MDNETPLLELENIHKSFGKLPVVQGVSLQLARGEIGCLLGPSGCGKTTLLRIIAGFEPIDKGQVMLNGRCISSSTVLVPAEKRNLGMVFQDYALFPHLSVAENIAFGITTKSRKEQERRVMELLELVKLESAGRSYPHELSGGQQQRVALARAIAPEPALLLLDEPFSNLDASLRETLTVEVRDIIKATETTALMVTHNQFEAFSVADKIGVTFSGTIRQWDSAYNVYHHPSELEVATFVGDGAIIKGEVSGPGTVMCGLGELRGSFTLPCAGGCQVKLLVRPEDILHDDSSPVQAKILHKSFRGPNILYKLELPSAETCLALVSSHHDHRLGEKIGIVPEVDNLVLFPDSHQ
jgi:iron(III) transport system ATP-binding protein